MIVTHLTPCPVMVRKTLLSRHLLFPLSVPPSDSSSWQSHLFTIAKFTPLSSVSSVWAFVFWTRGVVLFLLPAFLNSGHSRAREATVGSTLSAGKGLRWSVACSLPAPSGIPSREAAFASSASLLEIQNLRGSASSLLNQTRV